MHRPAFCWVTACEWETLYCGLKSKQTAWSVQIEVFFGVRVLNRNCWGFRRFSPLPQAHPTILNAGVAGHGMEILSESEWIGLPSDICCQQLEGPRLGFSLRNCNCVRISSENGQKNWWIRLTQRLQRQKCQYFCHQVLQSSTWSQLLLLSS